MDNHLDLTDPQIDHFHRQGFVLIPNPLGELGVREIDRCQQEVEPEWERREFPSDYNRLACQFFMVGEPLLRMAETPRIVGAARRLLDCEEIHVGACGVGDASRIIAEDGRPQRQVHWHADGSPEVRQVAFRTALDRHDTSNAPLRILPGSHLRAREEVAAEIMQLELATGTHDEPPARCFARHPGEVEVVLDPRWALVWTPSCWHATGVKTAAGPRRTMGWNYYPAGGRTRDLDALKHLHPDWEDWPEERQRLWGLRT
jgi:hypothetical protein